MPIDDIDPALEAHLLKRRLVELHDVYPAEATLIANILEALDYQKAIVRNELQLRGMVLAGGIKFARSRADESAWAGMLQQFAKQGALSAEQVAELQRQAGALRP